MVVQMLHVDVKKWKIREADVPALARHRDRHAAATWEDPDGAGDADLCARRLERRPRVL